MAVIPTLLMVYLLVASVTGAHNITHFTVTAGDKAILPCIVSEERKDFFYRSWKRGPYPVVNETTLFHQVTGSEPDRLKDVRAGMEVDNSNFSIMIQAANLEDNNVYMCYMYSEYPNYHRSYVFLNVKVPTHCTAATVCSSTSLEDGPSHGILPNHISAAVIGGSSALAVGLGIGIAVIVIVLYRRHKSRAAEVTWGAISFRNEGQDDILTHDKGD